MCRSRADGGQRCSKDAGEALARVTAEYVAACEEWDQAGRSPRIREAIDHKPQDDPARIAAQAEMRRHRDRVQALADRVVHAEIDYASTPAGEDALMRQLAGQGEQVYGPTKNDYVRPRHLQALGTAGIALRRRNEAHAQWAAQVARDGEDGPRTRTLAAQVHRLTHDLDAELDYVRGRWPNNHGRAPSRQWAQTVDGERVTLTSVGRWSPTDLASGSRVSTLDGEPANFGREPLDIVIVSGGRHDQTVCLMDRKHRLIAAGRNGALGLHERDGQHRLITEDSKLYGVVVPARGVSASNMQGRRTGQVSAPARPDPLPPLR